MSALELPYRISVNKKASPGLFHEHPCRWVEVQCLDPFLVHLSVDDDIRDEFEWMSDGVWEMRASCYYESSEDRDTNTNLLDRIEVSSDPVENAYFSEKVGVEIEGLLQKSALK